MIRGVDGATDYAGPGRGPARLRGAAGLALLFAAVLAITLLTLPERTYGDDVFFVWCIVRDRVFTPHVLYMPIARPWTRAFAEMGVDPLLALRVLAATGTAVGIALCAAAARRRGAPPLLAVGLALAVLTASSTWFFARAAEIHGVQLAAFGLAAWVVAGLRPGSSPWRMLAVALAFGVLVGAHKTSALLLPGVVAAYALATPRRPVAARVRDAAAFAAGGVASLGAMAGFHRAATGRWLSEQESASYWTEGFAASVGRLAPAKLAPFAVDAWIQPAFAVAVLGAAAAGALLRARPRACAALALTVAPHALVLPLFGWPERGAYLIVALPIALWALAGPLLAAGGPIEQSGGGSGATPHRALLAAGAAAIAGALFTPDELRAALGVPGLLAAVVAAFVAGLVAAPCLRPGGAPRALATPGRLAAAALALAGCQLVGSARAMHAWGAETPLLDWGRDAVAVAGDDGVVLLTGFQRYLLLMILDRAWEPPYRGTWEYANELATLGPHPFDVGDAYPKLADGIELYLAEGRRIFVLDTVFLHFENEPLRGSYVRALRQRYDLVPVSHGSFSAFEVLPRSER
jgi:hypothetical protein